MVLTVSYTHLTNLVVADESRTDKTICLAVTPSLKSYGISGRGRLFEVKQRVKEANTGRQHDAPGHRLEGSSYLFSELQENPSLAIDFIIAPPRMAYYMEYSTRIYQVYMKYVAPEDIIVYSICLLYTSMCSKSYAKPGITSVFLLTYTLFVWYHNHERGVRVDNSIA